MANQTLPGINYNKQSHESLRTLADRTIGSWEKRLEIPMTVSMLIEKVKRNLPVHLQVMHREQGSSDTEMVTLTDLNRDKAFQYFLRKVKSDLYSFDQDVVDSAENVFSVVESVGTDLHSLANDVQSDKMNQLVTLLSATELTTDIELLGYAEDIARINQFNSEFESAWKTRNKNSASENKLPAMKVVREEIQDGLRLLFKTSEFLYTENHSSVDEPFFTELSQHIKNAAS